ncbi:16S rRNA (adenine(1518)-N(6)/adenine(1519)-N(6))-dimethyltransferase RsmA [Candidatus Pacebacteria bacterium]|nr:16S rRNA (adenine(1518)-N(6)/adenine(1519)-N(6))-dimethyltransferase RsmA [Candidatus Paceibacterota bacterium]
MTNDSQQFEKKKSLGQHFLTSDVVPGWLCDAANFSQGDSVLEIGPGTGVLTRALLARGAQVIALEADHRAIEILQETFSCEISSGQLTVHHTDVRELDITKYSFTDHGFSVVANIPYYLSGHLFRTLLESDLQPKEIVFLIQKEVASRIAREQKESLLSLSVKAFGEPSYIRTVGKGHFSPPPKVDSAIIAVRNINRSHFAALPASYFFELLHLGFGQKRKQLLGNLANQYDRGILTHSFSTIGLNLTVRAEDMSLKTWLSLAELLYPHAA